MAKGLFGLFAKKYSTATVDAYIEDWRRWAAKADTLADMKWNKKTADAVVCVLDGMKDEVETWLEEYDGE